MSIPDDLMARFHEANEQFHQAKLRLDGLGEMNDEDRRDLGASLRAAEREVEAVTEQINQFLARDGHAGGGTPPAAGSQGQ